MAGTLSPADRMILTVARSLTDRNMAVNTNMIKCLINMVDRLTTEEEK